MKKLTNLQKAKLDILKWDISNVVNIFEAFNYVKRSDNSRSSAIKTADNGKRCTKFGGLNE